MVEKTTITAQKSLLRLPDGTYVIPFTNTSGAFEIGDIGQALFVDETKGTRRILNGQIVEINENTKPFLDYLLAVKTQYPQLFVTEGEWQAERASSAFNQVGKFVLNNDGIKYNYNVNIIGSPTQDNSVFSNISNANYVTTNNTVNFGTANTWEIVSKHRFNSVGSINDGAMGVLGGAYNVNYYVQSTNKFCIELSSNGSSYDIGSIPTIDPIPLNTDFYIKAEYTGTTYNLYFGYNLDEMVLQGTIENSTKVSNRENTFAFGVDEAANHTSWTGSFDLSGCYININGERWWTGVTTEEILPYVRIPAIINIQGLYELVNTGLRVNQSLPNVSGTFDGNTDDGASWKTGPFYIYSTTGTGANGGSGQGVVGFDLARANGIYKNGANVQQEAIQYPYFIQIAREQHTISIRNEWQTINPYTLFDHKYSYNPLNNASWLVSVKQQNPRQIYTSAYEALCVELNDAIQTNETVNLPSGGRYTKHLQTLYYDQSKLTLVGTPNITLNGLLSNANESNHVKLNVNTAISNATSYILKLRFQFITDSTIVSTSTTVTPNALLIRTVGDKIQTQISLNNVEWKYTLETANTFIEGNWYDLKLTFNNTNGYTFEISDDLGATYATEWFLREEVTRLTPESNFLLFGASYNLPGVPIDLKTIQFTYDGITINCNIQENLVWDSREHAPTEANYDKKFIVDRINETFRLPLKIDRELNNGEDIYFYIGSTAQNSALIDIGRITEQLARLQAEVDKLKG